jgi:DNA repair exonuclease SbcCD ATPase subunit
LLLQSKLLSKALKMQ